MVSLKSSQISKDSTCAGKSFQVKLQTESLRIYSKETLAQEFCFMLILQFFFFKRALFYRTFVENWF